MTLPPDPAQRVGDAERQHAIDLLGEHWRAGRLDPAEHERRTTAAFAAVTRGDVDALFADLPEPWPAGTGLATLASALEPVPLAGGSWLDGKREAIMGVTPFAALLLFFWTGTWLWFLAIPIMGALLFAGAPGRSRRRREARRARRDER